MLTRGMVRFVHQPSKSVGRWWGGRRKGGIQVSTAFSNTLFLKGLLCARHCSEWLAYISESTRQRCWPHILAFSLQSVAEKQGVDVVQLPFHHTSRSLLVRSLPLPRHAYHTISGPRAPSAMTHNITSSLGSGWTSIALLLVSPHEQLVSGWVHKLRRLENHPYLPHHPVVHGAGPQVHAGGIHL